MCKGNKSLGGISLSILAMSMLLLGNLHLYLKIVAFIIIILALLKINYIYKKEINKKS